MKKVRATAYMEADIQSARDGYAAPGQDTRQWVSYGIVNGETPPEPSPVVFDDENGDPIDEGPFVLVTLQPSAIPVMCRIASYVAGNLEGEWYPFVNGDEVLVAIPEGDENASPVIIGRLNQAVDKWPRSVAGNDATKNAVGFRRMRTPYVVETSSSYIIRSATTGAFLGIKADGSVTLGGGDGGNFILSPDAVGFQGDKDGNDVVQIDLKNHIFLVGLDAGTSSLVIGGETPGIRVQKPFYIASSGASAVFHAATVEGMVNFVNAVVTLIGPFIVPPLTPPQILSIINGALPVAAIAPVAPFQLAITAALAATPPQPPITDPLSADAVMAAAANFPGIGSPYLSIA